MPILIARIKIERNGSLGGHYSGNAASLRGWRCTGNPRCPSLALNPYLSISGNEEVRASTLTAGWNNTDCLSCSEVLLGGQYLLGLA